MRNTIPYLAFCATTIALLVFLNATQPFVLSQVFDLEQGGSASGLLALVDETVSLILAPFWGALSDKIGTRFCSFLGLCIMAAALSIYPRVPSIFPGLVLCRALFSIGAAGCVAMITAGLAELSLLAEVNSASSSRNSFSDSESPSNIFYNGRNGANTARGGDSDDDENYRGENEDEGDGDRTVPLLEAPVSDAIFDAVLASPRPNGKLAGFAGFASGIGAVFAVSLLLPLPTTLKGGAVSGIQEAFVIVSIGTFVVSLVLLATMYQNPARGIRSLLLGSENVSIFDEAAVDAGGAVVSYLELLQDGFLNARSDKRLQVAYFGSLVARAASVILALFVPLWVNQWFYQHGKCKINDPNGCHAAITQAAILTGIANTVMLLVAPVVGWAGDRYGSVRILGVSSGVGLVSMLGLLVTDSVSGLVPVLVSALAGASQIGVVTMSMSMSTDKRRVAGGSVAGVYSLCGSLGILLVTQLGGPLADIWIKSPFAIMAILFVVLQIVAHFLSSRTALRSSRSMVSLR